jgi:membrane fusion protein, adhesin transport system
MKTDFVSIRRGRKLKQLLLADTLEELGIVRLALAGITIVSLFAVMGILWASLAHMDEVSVAMGSLIPAGKVKEIQHLEGGIVSEILVAESQKVEADELLVILNPIATLSDLKESESRLIAAELDALRLNAFLENREFTLKYIISRINHITEDNHGQFKPLMDNALKLIREQKISRDSVRKELEQTVIKSREELAYAEQSIVNLQVQYKLAAEKTDMYRRLQAEAVSQVAYLDTKSEQAKIEGRLIETMSSQQKLRRDLSIAENKIDTLTASYKEETMQELNTTQAKILEQKNAIMGLQDKLERLKVRSTVAGIVKGIDVDVGTVLPGGGKLLEIIPLHEPLVAKVRVTPEDIGYVRAGHQVNIKVSAYNFTNFGAIPGIVEQVSGSTFVDPADGSTYYEAMVNLERYYFGKDPEGYKLMPGMSVTADIVTGDKTILQYMLKPVQSLFENPFSER